MTKEEATKLISDKIQQASNLISECEDIATEHGLSFSSPIGAYGMGGTFHGNPENSWQLSDGPGWAASSQSC